VSDDMLGDGEDGGEFDGGRESKGGGEFGMDGEFEDGGESGDDSLGGSEGFEGVEVVETEVTLPSTTGAGAMVVKPVMDIVATPGSSPSSKAV
jgi:hypothetical protein